MAEKVNVLGTILAVLHPDPHQSAVNRNLFMCATSPPPPRPPPPPARGNDGAVT